MVQEKSYCLNYDLEIFLSPCLPKKWQQTHNFPVGQCSVSTPNSLPPYVLSLTNYTGLSDYAETRSLVKFNLA